MKGENEKMRTDPIDFVKALKESYPKIFGRMPSVVFRIIGWFYGINIANGLSRYVISKGLTGTDAARVAMVEKHGITYTVVEEDRLPDKDTPCLFVSNHPLGWIDALIEMGMLSQHYPDVKVIGNEVNSFLKPFDTAILFVNVYGRTSRLQRKILIDAFRDKSLQILIFPAGACSRVPLWHVHPKDCTWNKNFIAQVVRTQRTVVPIYFQGRHSVFFYLTDIICRILHLPKIISTLMLPWENLRHTRRKHYTLYIGKPIPWTTFTKDKSPQQWADWLRDRTYDIPRDSLSESQTTVVPAESEGV